MQEVEGLEDVGLAVQIIFGRIRETVWIIYLRYKALITKRIQTEGRIVVQLTIDTFSFSPFLGRCWLERQLLDERNERLAFFRRKEILEGGESEKDSQARGWWRRRLHQLRGLDPLLVLYIEVHVSRR